MYFDFALLSLFVPTFFFVSLTPGMCMTLALSLGIAVGLKRALWMMLGELFGVGLVATLSIVGVAALMLHYPMLFLALKYAGGLYLGYLGIMLWQSKGKMALSHCSTQVTISRRSLIFQGFLTAIANPKGWAFFIALLPPFIVPNKPLLSQIITLISIILLLEFLCLLIYAGGGQSLRKMLKDGSNVQILNKIAGSLMLGVGVWLAFF